jgi:hypothetical protein
LIGFHGRFEQNILLNSVGGLHLDLFRLFETFCRIVGNGVQKGVSCESDATETFESKRESTILRWLCLPQIKCRKIRSVLVFS